MVLNEYNMDITYRQGKCNSNADSLSRRLTSTPVEDGEDGQNGEERPERLSLPTQTRSLATCAAMGFEAQWSIAEIQKLQAADPDIAQVIEQLSRDRPPFAGQWRKSGKLRQFGRVWHQLTIKTGVLYRTRYSGPAEGARSRSYWSYQQHRYRLF